MLLRQTEPEAMVEMLPPPPSLEQLCIFAQRLARVANKND